jgi:hypothetical protein
MQVRELNPKISNPENPFPMHDLLAAGHSLWNMNLWFALPAIVAISLVYAATRHERLRPIFAHATRVGVWIVGFMLAVFVIIEVVSWGL